ncbi:MAG: hypothetical protein WCC26_16310, partial [Terracidiphilus sp.]
MPITPDKSAWRLGYRDPPNPPFIKVAVAIGVWTKSLARRTLLQWLSAGIVGCVSLGSQEVYRDPSSAADA